ncbi:MAG: hypothetical protein PF485_09465 [Bacteroidales bacterium]|jgi:hypothetical protein|nr:hypothetical protein [Bacteroidales bacterium]
MVEITKIGESKVTNKSFKDEPQQYRHVWIKDLENGKEIIYNIFFDKYFHWWREIERFLNDEINELPLINGEIIIHEMLDILVIDDGVNYNPPELKYESYYWDQHWRLDRRYRNFEPNWIWEK